MIPILFDKNEVLFTSNGLGRLTECKTCFITEERNGEYIGYFEYPIDGRLYSQIQEGCYIYTTHDASEKPQAFQIYRRSAPLEGFVKFDVWHISYALNQTIVKPYTAATCAAALAAIPNNSIIGNPFTFWTDKSVAGSFSMKYPKSARAILGGSSGSILDKYGKGDYEFDMYSVKLYTNRGTDRGVSIRYGKNLVSLDQQKDASNLYNAVVPYWTSNDGDEVVALDYPIYANAPTEESPLETHDYEVITTHDLDPIMLRYAVLHTKPLDLSSYFDEKPTPEQLAEKAANIVQANDNYEVKENIAVDFVALWQTEEYKNVAALQKAYLCDTVHIVYTKLGINATAKVIKTTYDSLNERYTSIELGQAKTTLGQQISELVSGEIMSEVPTRAAMQAAIDRQTALLTGAAGGYHVQIMNAEGEPEEDLWMDTPDVNTAQNILRINRNGIGFSRTGIAGPYYSAWTIDGSFNADFITAGTIAAARIASNSLDVDKLSGEITGGDSDSWVLDLTAGTLTIGTIAVNKITGSLSNTAGWAIDFTNGTLTIGEISANKIKAGTIADDLTTPKNYWNLTTGEFVTTQGTLGGFTIDSDGLTASSVVGEMTITPSTILTKTLSLTKNRMAAMSGGQLTLSTQDDNLDWQSCLSLYALALPDNKRNGTIAGPNSNTYINMGETGIVLHLDSSIGGQELNMNPNGISLNSKNGYFRINTGTGTFTVNSHQVLEIH